MPHFCAGAAWPRGCGPSIFGGCQSRLAVSWRTGNTRIVPSLSGHKELESTASYRLYDWGGSDAGQGNQDLAVHWGASSIDEDTAQLISSQSGYRDRVHHLPRRCTLWWMISQEKYHKENKNPMYDYMVAQTRVIRAILVRSIMNDPIPI